MIALSVSELKLGSPSVDIETRVANLRAGLAQYGGGFTIPPDSGKKTALARVVAAIFASLSAPTLYIPEWGVWPSSQNLDLFDSYRQAKGETRSLDEAPVHCFSSASEEAFLGILCLALYFVWDAEVFDRDDKCLISISHDEWLEIRTADPKVRNVCDQAVAQNRLKALFSTRT